MDTTVFLTFHDSISLESANRFMNICNKVIEKHKPKEIYILFSSGGGSVDSGVTLFNYLKGLSQTIIMHNIGSIDSIANVVFLAGDKRYATPASSFLLHGINWIFEAASSLTYTQMQETMSRFDAAEQLSAQIIGNNTNLSKEDVRSLFRQGAAKSPEFALEKGFIHEIKDVGVPDGAPMYSIVQ